jgi:hypothetical protein
VWRIEAPALVALLGVACGGGGRPPAAAPPDGAIADGPATDLNAAESPPADGPPSLSDFAARYCGLLTPCCQDQDRCRQSVEAMNPYRPAMAEACLAALGSAGSPSLCTDGFRGAALACQRTFAARVATQRLGQPCAQNEDCLLSPQGPVRCAGDGGMGRCQVVLPGKPGSGPCVATASGPVTVPGGDLASTAVMGYTCDVASGVWCDDVSGKCAPVQTIGAACTSFGQCGPTGWCDDGAGKCAPRKPEGAACAVDEECPSTVCGEDNRCAPPVAVDPALMQLCSTP